MIYYVNPYMISHLNMTSVFQNVQANEIVKADRYVTILSPFSDYYRSYWHINMQQQVCFSQLKEQLYS